MNILRIISSMSPAAGGPPQGIRNLVPELERMGFHNEVVTVDSPKADFLGQDAFPIHPLGPKKSSWAYSPKLLPWLREHLSGYDAVILHGLWQYPAYAVYKAMREARSKEQRAKSKREKAPSSVPHAPSPMHSAPSSTPHALCPAFYIYPHGMLDPWFQRDKSRRVKAVRNWFYWKLMENRVIAAADAVLFTCEEEKRLAATTFHPYRPRATVTVGYGIPDPVDVGPALAPRQGDLAMAAFYERFPELRGKRFLLFLSRIHPKKGVDLLLKAWRGEQGAGGMEQASGPVGPTPRRGAGDEGEAAFHLVIAGPCADAGYWEELQSLAVSLGLQDGKISLSHLSEKSENTPQALSPMPHAHGSAVLWPGMLTGDLKWGALLAADAFILPSHQENFGIAVVEALACGTPVLISDQVNICREIEQAQAGFVAPDTVEGTADLLRHWFALDEDEKTARRRKARECFLQTFTVAAAAEKLTAVLRSPILH